MCLCSGAARSSSLPSVPSWADRSGVASWWSLGSAVPLFLLNRSRPLLSPQREPTAQQLQGAARHLEGHHRQPPTTVNRGQWDRPHLHGVSYLFPPPDDGWEHFACPAEASSHSSGWNLPLTITLIPDKEKIDWTLRCSPEEELIVLCNYDKFHSLPLKSPVEFFWGCCSFFRLQDIYLPL